MHVQWVKLEQLNALTADAFLYWIRYACYPGWLYLQNLSLCWKHLMPCGAHVWRQSTSVLTYHAWEQCPDKLQTRIAFCGVQRLPNKDISAAQIRRVTVPKFQAQRWLWILFFWHCFPCSPNLPLHSATDMPCKQCLFLHRKSRCECANAHVCRTCFS